MAALAALPFALAPREAGAFAYVFATEANPARVTHAMGYAGVGGTLNLTIGIDATSAHAAEMSISVANAVNTWNQRTVTTGNIASGGANNVPAGQYDFESTVLHELGHALGLDHPNMGAVTGPTSINGASVPGGISGSNTDFTQSANGPNNTFDFGAGGDGVIGSADDARGDDVNLNWFRIADNDPFALAGVVDATTYSRDLANLPGGDSFSANGSRNVANLLGYADTESVLQQGQPADEAQRTLTADDIAGILLAAAGLDGLAGTSDDYVLNLIFAGITAVADILLDFDSSKTAFAETELTGVFLGGPGHVAVETAALYFSDSVSWFFNDVSSVPSPAALTLFLSGLGGIALTRRRRRAG